MEHGKEVNYGTWNEVHHMTWERGKSWNMGMRYIMGHGKAVDYRTWNEVHHGTWE